MFKLRQIDCSFLLLTCLYLPKRKLNHLSFCAARTIRDSGYSSGDPSPNNLTSAASSSDLLLNGHEPSTTKDYHRSNSMPAPQSVTRNRRKTKRPSK